MRRGHIRNRSKLLVAQCCSLRILGCIIRWSRPQVRHSTLKSGCSLVSGINFLFYNSELQRVFKVESLLEWFLLGNFKQSSPKGLFKENLFSFSETLTKAYHNLLIGKFTKPIALKSIKDEIESNQLKLMRSSIILSYE